MAKPRKSESGREQEEEKKERVTPDPPPRRKHRRKHWDHLPDLKRKQVKSFKSPGRK